MTNDKDKQQALENLKALEEAKLISRRDFLTLSSQLGSGVVLLNFLTPDRALAWVATRMRKGKSSDIALNPDVGDITKSLRFRSSASSYFNRTPGSAGDRLKWTISFWVKRGEVGASAGPLFSATIAAGATEEYIGINNDSLIFNDGAAGMMTNLPSKLRDVSAWYHVVYVYDSANATQANRGIFYINGVAQTASTNSIALNRQSYWNSTTTAAIAKFAQIAGIHFNGFLSRVVFIDGQALTPSSFGYLNSSTNSWVTKTQSAVKAIVDTGGINSFMLEFDNGTSTATLGYDKSSKGNNWTTNNISLTAGTDYDWMNDVPGNSFANTCSLNPKPSSYSVAHAGIGVYYDGVTVSQYYILSPMPSSGKWYFEALRSGGLLSGTYYGYLGLMVAGSSVYSHGPTGADNVICCFAIDMDSGKFWAGTTLNNTDIASGINSTGTFTPGSVVSPYVSSAWGWTFTGYFMFGQSPLHSAATFHSSANGYFRYTPPSGYKAICQKNLAAPTIVNAKKHFDITLHSGSASSVTTTGLLFQPDFNWTKKRSGAAADSSVVMDIARGFNNRLFTALTSAENTTTTITVNSNGVTYLPGYGVTNEGAGYTYVDWLWKAGGATVSNSQGSITSQVSANTAAGFSIVSANTSSAVNTIGHGLGVVPGMIIGINRAAPNGWFIYHKALTSASYYVRLDSTIAQTLNNSAWNGTLPTSTVFTQGSGAWNNGASAVFYCFAEISGYSKIGSYTGNGSTDGPFVYCGFKPKYILWKRIDSTGDWIVQDYARAIYNPSDTTLYPHLSAVEGTGGGYTMDFLSNGFKIRNSATYANASGATYIFIAFAEVPFKYANAR